MARKRASRTSSGKSLGEEFVETLEGLYRHRRIVAAALVALAVIIGIYLRVLPAVETGRVELRANDPWIEYWLTDYVYRNGFTSWFSLSPGNPDTHLFWYPWGRDFTYSEYPGIPWIAALTYPIAETFGLSLKSWVALQPVLAGALAVVAAYFLGRELTGELGGITTAFLIAVIPAATDRTTVGFVEKQGFATPLLILQALFLARMVKYGRPRDALLAGIITGAVGLVWGGVYIALALAVAYMVILPLLMPGLKREHVLAMLIFVSSLEIVLLTVPKLTRPGTSLFWNAVPILAFILLAIGQRLNRVQYLIVLGLVAVAGLLAAHLGLVPLAGRLLAAIGLRAEASPLVKSVAEHRSLLSQGLTTFMVETLNEMTPAVLLAMAYIVYILLYRRDPYHGFVALAAGLTLYAYGNMAYFAQIAGLYSGLATGLLVGMVAAKGFEHLGSAFSTRKPRRKRLATGARLTETAYLAIILVILVSANIAYAAYMSYDRASRLAGESAGGLTPSAPSGAWPLALKYIRENLSDDAVVVSWWDYGYWISVVGGKASLADGATLNSTQIKILGDILTSDEDRASELLRKLHLVPGKTYVLVYDVFVMEYNETMGFARIYPVNGRGAGDLRKAVWMLAIPGKIDLDKANQILSELNGVAADYQMARNQPISYDRITGTELYRELERIISPYMAAYFDPQRGYFVDLALNFSNAQNMLLVGIMSQAIYTPMYAMMTGLGGWNDTWVGDVVPYNASQAVFMASVPSNPSMLDYVPPAFYRHFTVEKVFTGLLGKSVDTERGVEIYTFVAVFLAKWMG